MNKRQRKKARKRALRLEMCQLGLGLVSAIVEVTGYDQERVVFRERVKISTAARYARELAQRARARAGEG